MVKAQFACFYDIKIIFIIVIEFLLIKMPMIVKLLPLFVIIISLIKNYDFAMLSTVVEDILVGIREQIRSISFIKGLINIMRSCELVVRWVI